MPKHALSLFFLSIFTTSACFFDCSGMRFPTFFGYLRHCDLLALLRGHALSLFSCSSSSLQLACFVARAWAFPFFLFIFATTTCSLCCAGMRFPSFPFYLRHLSCFSGRGILDSCGIACPKVLLQRIYGQRDLKHLWYRMPLTLHPLIFGHSLLFFLHSSSPSFIFAHKKAAASRGSLIVS